MVQRLGVALALGDVAEAGDVGDARAELDVGEVAHFPADRHLLTNRVHVELIDRVAPSVAMSAP